MEINLASGPVNAYTFIADTGHTNYAGQLPIDEIVEIIRNAKGAGGDNLNYLHEVIKKLKVLGQSDARLNVILHHLKKDYKSWLDGRNLRESRVNIIQVVH